MRVGKKTPILGDIFDNGKDGLPGGEFSDRTIHPPICRKFDEASGRRPVPFVAHAEGRCVRPARLECLEHVREVARRFLAEETD